MIICTFLTRAGFIRRVIFLNIFLLLGIAVVIFTAKHFFHNDLSFQPVIIDMNTSVQSIDVLKLDQKDPSLRKYIQNHHILRPSTLPYNLSSLSTVGNRRKGPRFLQTLFEYKKHGVFVEVGANDGEFLSTTLDLERMGWSGLLMECNPVLFKQLQAKHRKAWTSNSCLSSRTTPELVLLRFMKELPSSSQVIQRLTAFYTSKTTHPVWLSRTVVAFPLYSLIKSATASTEIDFLSFSTGHEIEEVLTNYPFHDLQINVILVEVIKLSREKRARILYIMKLNGFHALRNEPQAFNWIFVNNHFKTKKDLKKMRLF